MYIYEVSMPYNLNHFVRLYENDRLKINCFETLNEQNVLKIRPLDQCCLRNVNRIINVRIK